MDLGEWVVELSTGEQHEYDHLVIATGVQPVQLSDGHHLAGVHVLRTLDDAVALRKSLLEASSVVVVGPASWGRRRRRLLASSGAR
ncbi:FAD-dependent oxidoreductase [Kribbella flavida]|uniref:FAD-dependent oxidoreductase n=1 Tax=Kribbella flavida TaxID=182640 RepID=UPI00019BD7D4|nr:FAD/NAD(P)-binding oxidoreductase [Kribbella flavida]